MTDISIFIWPTKIHTYWNEYAPEKYQSVQKQQANTSQVGPTVTAIATATATTIAPQANEAIQKLEDRFTIRVRNAFKNAAAPKRTTFVFSGSSSKSAGSKKELPDERLKEEFQKCFEVIQIVNRTVHLGSELYQYKLLRLQFLNKMWSLLAKNPEQFRQKFVPYDESLLQW
ncbi:hypothetical protein RFI_06870 [Reticulomyxa filosa]|uniref:Uncharacterized protein n=1 Tax=Reticulomyxa filosa TaxID=46433 RepID=X6NWJ5_RETFI|nr:hypothetical protein RFI_06870 [Reticulomyxa filosa]|eukprot:ETO30253.1 hypothetical protein RFI_06870 [Reticulomyxa filosa]